MDLKVKVYNIIFRGLTKDYILSLLDKNDFSIITPVNAELIVLANENEKFRNVLNKHISTFDGQIPYLIAKLKNKHLKIEKLSGSDIIFDICKEAEKKNLKVFLLGGSIQANIKAQEYLRNLYPKLKINGYSPPFNPYPFPKKIDEKILEKISSYRPDIIFVGFGAPKQEYWLEDHRDFLKKLGVKLGVAVGGTFEILAGFEKRAPKIIQKLGFESIWRLYQNPKRYKRFIKQFKFFKYIFS